MLELLKSNLVVVLLGLVSLAAIVYLYRELRRAKTQLADAAAPPAATERRKRVTFEDPAPPAAATDDDEEEDDEDEAVVVEPVKPTTNQDSLPPSTPTPYHDVKTRSSRSTPSRTQDKTGEATAAR